MSLNIHTTAPPPNVWVILQWPAKSLDERGSDWSQINSPTGACALLYFNTLLPPILNAAFLVHSLMCGRLPQMNHHPLWLAFLLFFLPTTCRERMGPVPQFGSFFFLFFFLRVFLFGVIPSATALAIAWLCLKQILWFHGDGDSFYHTVVDRACVHTYRYYPKN